MSQTNLFTINKTGAPATCNLQSFQSQPMACPVSTLGAPTCYFIPLAMIDGYQHNPGRSGGTQTTIVSQIFDSMITEPKGQLEPICVEWNPATQMFEIVFGCHREWATSDAYSKGFAIANHPQLGIPGIWAWIFTGSPAERTKIQMRENGNKKPQSPATKDEMVDMLGRYISQGGLDIGYTTSFTNLTDQQKYKRAQKFMSSNTPFWGGRKFKGVWNKLTQNGNATVNLAFTTFSKEKLAEYFCSNNSYGIKMEDLRNGNNKSGSVVKKNGKTYGIYFVNAKTEIGGALPTNASKLRVNEGITDMILVGCLNDSGTATIVNDRHTFETRATWWNSNIFKSFNEVFWMPQTKSEYNKHMVAGTWVAQNPV